MNLVVGSKFMFREPLFEGSFRKPKFTGRYRTLTVKVLKESYGAQRGQHTFTLEVLECEAHANDNIPAGEKIRRKGRNLYPNILGSVTQPDDYALRAEEKATRAKVVRARLAQELEF